MSDQYHKGNKVINIVDNIWQCCDCGAHAEDSAENIKHYDSCKVGEADKWEEYCG